jgi:hypothetical protein
VDTEDVVHVLRRVHRALRDDGLLLDVHPTGEEFAVRAGGRGLGFVDTREFVDVLEAMEEGVRQVVDDGLLVEVQSLRRHVVERFDTGAEVLAEADGWENLRLPAAVRRRLRGTDASPVELVDTVVYRLFRKQSPAG